VAWYDHYGAATIRISHVSCTAEVSGPSDGKLAALLEPLRLDWKADVCGPGDDARRLRKGGTDQCSCGTLFPRTDRKCVRSLQIRTNVTFSVTNAYNC